MRRVANSLRHIVDVAGRQCSSDVIMLVVTSTATVPSSGHTKDLEPFACVIPDHDVLIDVSSRTEDIPFLL